MVGKSGDLSFIELEDDTYALPVLFLIKPSELFYYYRINSEGIPTIPIMKETR